MSRFGSFAVGLAVALVAESTVTLVLGATFELRPVADTSLFEPNPGNNLGASLHLPVGTTSGGKKSRMLLRFDLGDSIPKGSTIRSVALQFDVVKTPLSGGTGSILELRRLYRAWSEGAKAGNVGAPASGPEATWQWRFDSASSWSTPGGMAPADFAETISAEIPFDQVKRYTVATTPGMVSDVQFWNDNPESNFGWLLMVRPEETAETARRIASREDASLAPVLRIEFDAPSAAFRITSTVIRDNKLVLQWEGGTPPFQVQTLDRVEGEWQNAGPATEATSTEIPMGGTEAFVRVVSEVTAQYQVEFASTWGTATHPDRFPPSPHWSGLVGATHNDRVVFWAEGARASTGIKNMAEFGSKVALLQEADTAIANGTAWSRLSGGGINPSPGTVVLAFDVHRDFPLVTLTSMIAPSPDWFVGVAGLNLIENGRWIAEKEVPLLLYDAGTDSGDTYTAPDVVTAPAEPIRQIDGFPAVVNGQLTTFGTFRFTKQ